MLAGHVVPELTKRILRNSDFTSEDLFGSLPESFEELVITEQGKHLRISKKRTHELNNLSDSYLPRGRGAKRAGRGARGNPVKRLNTTSFTPRGNGRGQPFRGARGRRGKK